MLLRFKPSRVAESSLRLNCTSASVQPAAAALEFRMTCREDIDTDSIRFNGYGYNIQSSTCQAQKQQSRRYECQFGGKGLSELLLPPGL